MRRSHFSSLIFLAATFGASSRTFLAAEVPVQFDLPAVAVASHWVPIPEPNSSPSPLPTGWKTVNFELRLSCINASASSTPMQQCVVRVKPRDPSLQIVDYSPRTEVTSELTTPIQVKRIDEKSGSIGLSLDGNYGHLAHGNVGSDRGSKKTESVQFDRAAPVQAVIASGTFDRGRGVYFKFRRTDTQVLEGERRFQLTMSVPPTWRGELVDVAVVGEAEHRSYTSWESELQPVAAADFIVAAYLENDAEAASLAYRIADAEYELRTHATRSQSPPAPNPFVGMLRHVATTIDPHKDDPTWVSRLLLGQADPHLDRTLLQLPADVRSVAIGYVHLRQHFLAFDQAPSSNAVAQLPAAAKRVSHPSPD